MAFLQTAVFSAWAVGTDIVQDHWDAMQVCHSESATRGTHECMGNSHRDVAVHTFKIQPVPQTLLGLPSLQKCDVKCLVKFDLDFDLKLEISDGKNLVKFGRTTFLSARKAREISGQNLWGNFGESFGNFVSNLATFFANFIQQKGGAKTLNIAN